MSDRSRLPQTPKTSEDRFDILCASKDLFQHRLTDIIRQCGMRMPTVLEAFSQEIGTAHDELVAASGLEEDTDQRSDFTASRLTLMGDEDLELDIRIRSLAVRLREAGGHNLWRSQLRYMTLLSRPSMSEAANPVGPEVICLGLWAICRHAGGDLEPTLALLDRLEQGLCQQIPGLYREIDGLLASHGIGPAPGQNTSVTTELRSGRAQAGENQPAIANALSTLQQAVSQQLETDQPADPLQLSYRGARSANPALDAAARIMLDHLFDRLTAIENRSAAASPDDAVAESPPRTPLSALKAKDLDLPLGKREAVTLDTLALIFEAIFDSTELPKAIKAAIGRLQMPLIKLAIIDPSLFSNDQHPARSLINRMARAALGLPQESEHPLCQRIGRLTVIARQTLEQNGSLDPQLAELDMLIRARDQAVRQAAEPHVQLLLEHENRQYSTRLADNWLRVSRARTRSPEIASFLEQYWLRVMIAAAADGGIQGERWQQDSNTADELIWSVLPKPTAEERKRLAGLASSLLVRIGAGLDSIGVSAAERRPFLNTLFDLQTSALRRQALAAAPAVERQVYSGASNPTAETGFLERNGRQLRFLPVPAGSKTPQRAPAGESPVGEWLRFLVSPQESLCGLCCWQSPASGMVLLFNPEWDYAVAMPQATLEQQLRSGHARIVSRIAVFDAAAECALKRLEQR